MQTIPESFVKQRDSKMNKNFLCDRVYDQGFISSAVYKLFALLNQFYEGKSIIFCQFLTQQKKIYFR